MKIIVTKALAGCLAMAGLLLFTTSCVEHRYYHEHHRHSPRYYERHHMPEPKVDVIIHN